MKKAVAFVLAVMMVALIAISACAREQHYHTYYTEREEIVVPEYVIYATIDRGTEKDVYEVHLRKSILHQKCTDLRCPARRDLLKVQELSRKYLRTI